MNFLKRWLKADSFFEVSTKSNRKMQKQSTSTSVELGEEFFLGVIEVIENRGHAAGVASRSEVSKKLNIVGESYYQEAIRILAKDKPGKSAGRFAGFIIPEQENEFDANAVALYLLNENVSPIDAVKVGYLSGEAARSVSPKLVNLFLGKGQVVPVLASLSGAEGSTKPQYGVNAQVFFDI
jgi:hypothetical protein